MLLREHLARVKQNFPVPLSAWAERLNLTAILAPKLLLQPAKAGENTHPYPFKLISKSNMKKITKKSGASSAKSSPPAKTAKAPARKTAAPAKKKTAVASEPPATFISAKVDLGFGNHLYLRGDGPGLSWDHGVAMDCVGAKFWTINVKNAAEPVVFKVLANDLSWSEGPDYTVQPGQSITITPTF